MGKGHIWATMHKISLRSDCIVAEFTHSNVTHYRMQTIKYVGGWGGGVSTLERSTCFFSRRLGSKGLGFDLKKGQGGEADGPICH